MDGLRDRVALVTGAASGIGAAVARRLHSAGARVYCVVCFLVSDAARHITGVEVPVDDGFVL